MTEQQYIQRIQQLEFQLQQKQEDYRLLHDRAKKLIDAADDYRKNINKSEDIKKAKIAILQKQQKSLKELIYPETKQTYQAKMNWLGQ